MIENMIEQAFEKSLNQKNQNVGAPSDVEIRLTDKPLDHTIDPYYGKKYTWKMGR